MASCANGRGVPEPLTPKDKNSFAYPTMKDRVPIIICKVIDLLYRDRINLKLSKPDELKDVIGLMSKLRQEMMTNKPLCKIEDNGIDAHLWNEYLERLKAENNEESVRWYNTRWLSVECFVYRRLLEAMRKSADLGTFDFFGKQKCEAFYGSLKAICNLLIARDSWPLKDPSKVEGLIKISLWGNKCDLSISAGSSQSFHHDPMAQIDEFKSRLLVDDSKKVIDIIKLGEDMLIDIIMDNAGFEMLSDLCLADYLISSNFAKRIRFRVKNQPWFVSDTMPQDFDWVLNEMCSGATNDIQSEKSENSDITPILVKYGEKWKSYLEDGIWSIHPDPFWTYPHDYSLMKSDDKLLYQTLSEADLLIFKGDLNYRKLVGDLNWKPTDTFKESLQGFHPAPLVALRTLKADVVTGLSEGQAESAQSLDEKWLINGEWGVIQLCPVKIC